MTILMYVLMAYSICGIAAGLILAIFWKYTIDDKGNKKTVIKFPRYINFLLYILVLIASPVLAVVLICDSIGHLISWLKEEVTV